MHWTHMEPGGRHGPGRRLFLYKPVAFRFHVDLFQSVHTLRPPCSMRPPTRSGLRGGHLSLPRFGPKKELKGSQSQRFLQKWMQ